MKSSSGNEDEAPTTSASIQTKTNKFAVKFSRIFRWRRALSSKVFHWFHVAKCYSELQNEELSWIKLPPKLFGKLSYWWGHFIIWICRKTKCFYRIIIRTKSKDPVILKKLLIVQTLWKIRAKLFATVATCCKPCNHMAQNVKQRYNFGTKIRTTSL